MLSCCSLLLLLRLLRLLVVSLFLLRAGHWATAQVSESQSPLTEERPLLEEQLRKLSRRGGKGHMKYRFAARLPAYTDIFCFPASGKDTDENVICYVENLCAEFSNSKLWISKDGYRENVPARLQLTSYRELTHMHRVRYYEYDNDNDSAASGQNDTNSVVFVNNPAFLFRRIGPRNMMHALHDDLIPLIATVAGLEEFQEDQLTDDVLFVAVDGFNFKTDPVGPFEVIGQTMELEQIPYKVAGPFKHRELKYVCFERAYLGMETSTTWYHYGYTKMQGPIDGINKEHVGRNVRLITNWIVDRLAELHWSRKTGLVPLSLAKPEEYLAAWREGRELEEHAKPYISVIVRRKSRMMMNQDDFIKDLTRAFPHANVKILDEERMLQHELIYYARHSVAMVGMHGALLSMAMFMPPGAVLIEMYPFGVPGENYTPYKTLASLGSYNFRYRTWTNPYEEAPFNQGHPDNIMYYGGLKHLPESYAQGVLATKTVPKHICCYSPFWIYRIFQDTWVDSNAVIKLIQSAY